MNLFSDKRALVTGSASGIGRAVATALAAEGARVLGCDVDAGGAALAAGAGFEFMVCDLSSDSGQDELLAQARSRLGALDIFVHSASPRRREDQTIFALTDAQWDQMLNVNLRAAFRLGRAIGQQMRDQGSGNLLFLTSHHANTPRNLPHYSASKGAVQMLVRELAKALAPHGVRVNAIAPGAIAGGGFTPSPTMAAKIPMKRLGKPDDVALAALGLLNDHFNAYVTGATLVVDGGLGLYNWIDPT